MTVNENVGNSPKTRDIAPMSGWKLSVKSLSEEEHINSILDPTMEVLAKGKGNL